MTTKMMMMTMIIVKRFHAIAAAAGMNALEQIRF